MDAEAFIERHRSDDRAARRVDEMDLAKFWAYLAKPANTVKYKSECPVTEGCRVSVFALQVRWRRQARWRGHQSPRSDFVDGYHSAAGHHPAPPWLDTMVSSAAALLAQQRFPSRARIQPGAAMIEAAVARGATSGPRLLSPGPALRQGKRRAATTSRLPFASATSKSLRISDAFATLVALVGGHAGRWRDIVPVRAGEGGRPVV